jgi:hypothetical protein
MPHRSHCGSCRVSTAATHAPWRSATPGRTPRFVRHAFCRAPCSLPHDSSQRCMPWPTAAWPMPRSTIARSDPALLVTGAFLAHATQPIISRMPSLLPSCRMLRGDPQRRVARRDSCTMPHISQCARCHTLHQFGFSTPFGAASAPHLTRACTTDPPKSGEFVYYAVSVPGGGERVGE